MPSEPSASQAGIQTAQSGERHIPSSLRPDGSTRKEIKIRPGYRPPEDVEVYKNKSAESWKNRGSGGIPGAAAAANDISITTTNNNKNAKRREARRKAKATIESTDIVATEGTAVPESKSAGDVAQGDSNTNSDITPKTAEELDGAEKERQSRNLRKKLRQARELKEKKENGESLLPDQFAKVIKIQELVRQLEMLGFDADGNAQKQADPS